MARTSYVKMNKILDSYLDDLLTDSKTNQENYEKLNESVEHTIDSELNELQEEDYIIIAA